jgi:hypothetical protein
MNVLVVDVGGAHVKVVASGQSYKGGKMLFLGLGTGLGSTMIADGIVEPMELGHLPYKSHTYEEYVGQQVGTLGAAQVAAPCRGRRSPFDRGARAGRRGSGRWERKTTREFASGCRAGDNANAFIGGFRLWENAAEARPSSTATTPSKHLHNDTKGAPIWKQ